MTTKTERRTTSKEHKHMGTHLDLDDVAAGHPLALAELATLRKRAEDSAAQIAALRNVIKRVLPALEDGCDAMNSEAVQFRLAMGRYSKRRQEEILNAADSATAALNAARKAIDWTPEATEQEQPSKVNVLHAHAQPCEGGSGLASSAEDNDDDADELPQRGPPASTRTT